MNQTGSYQFEKLEGRHQEAHFLEQRAQMRLEGFPDLLLRHGFNTQGRVLEVGTAQGIRAHVMAKKFPHAQIIGIDRSEELLFGDSEKKSIPSNLSFLKADIYELPFADQSFDFIYARLVFMHLTYPIQALKSLYRLLAPGGKILIEDADRDCMFFEPAPKSFAPFWEKVQKGQRRLGGDPNVGRKLAPYLKEIGFNKINLEVQTILGNGHDIEFLAKTLLPSLNVYLDLNDRAQGERAIEDVRALAEDPRASFYHFWFAVSGEKP